MVASVYPAYRLSFRLPASLAFATRAGVWHPCLAGTLVLVGEAGLVTVDGKSRELVFNQTARFFRAIAKDRPPIIIAAHLIGPERRRDSWTITLNAAVSFAPTGLGTEIPGAAA